MKLYFPKYISLFILLFVSTSLFSQNKLESDCGTITSLENIDYFKSLKSEMRKHEQDFFQKQYAKATKSKKTVNNIPIKIHIIRESDGTKGLTEDELKDAIDNLNTIYTDSYMQFYIYEGVNYIDGIKDYTHFKKGEEKTLTETYYVPGIINIYFTNYIENTSEQSICGYGINQKNLNVILMKNACAKNNSSLAHEMGHVFSLVHTHGPWNSKLTTELVDGSNCDTDGDGICDTPADPRLSTQNTNSNCEYIGNQTDSKGDLYVPDTENIMSYSRKSCRGYFSEQQLARMYAFFQTEKSGFVLSDQDLELQFTPSKLDTLNNISIYPNPVTNHTIYLKNSEGYDDISYQITNIQGQILSKGNLINGKLNVKALSSGSYLILIKTADSNTVKRFIK
jgi:hypothetical protein